MLEAPLLKATGASGTAANSPGAAQTGGACPQGPAILLMMCELKRKMIKLQYVIGMITLILCTAIFMAGVKNKHCV